jgi:hypothetical protein
MKSMALFVALLLYCNVQYAAAAVYCVLCTVYCMTGVM